MKNLLLTIAALCFVFSTNSIRAQSEIPYSAEEILEKCIQFHDPEGKWENYSGALKMNVAFSGGNTYGTEIVEIDVPNNFYKWTRIIPNYKIVQSIKNGKIYYSVNGNLNPTEEQRKAFWINEDGIRQMKEHHFWHFGRLTYMIKDAIELQNKVEKTDFYGTACYQLIFIGNNEKIKNQYFAGENKFLIDAKTFALIACIFSNGYLKFEGIIDINGIKIPAINPWYSKSGEFQGATLFSCADDNYRMPKEYLTNSQPTGSNIGLKSTHLLKLENEEALKKLEQPIKELNEALAEMGYPECGYVIYKVNNDHESDYTHVMEGWWLNKKVYDLTHDHPKYNEVFEKYRGLFVSALEGQDYFRVEKMIPKMF